MAAVVMWSFIDPMHESLSFLMIRCYFTVINCRCPDMKYFVIIHSGNLSFFRLRVNPDD